MSPETPNPLPEPAATVPSSTRRRNIFGGALLGAVTLTASVVAVGAVAGAQDEPAVDDADAVEAIELSDAELDEMDLESTGFDGIEFDDEAWAAFDECLTDALGPIDEDGATASDEAELSDEEWEALEAQFEAAEEGCEDLLPEDIKAEIEAFQPFEDCIDSQLGDLEEPDFDGDVTEEQLAELDTVWMAAEEACFDLLPEDAKVEVEAFKAFDQCLTDAGLDDSFGEDFGTVVYVEGEEGGQSIQFGDTPGTVTITGDASGVSVATEGGVTVLDEAAIDEAFSACDELLPEDLFEFDGDEFELDGFELGEDDGA